MAINTITKYYGADTYFNGNVTFYKDVNFDTLNSRAAVFQNLSVTGVSTIGNLRVNPTGTGSTVGTAGIVTYYGDAGNMTVNGTSLTTAITGIGAIVPTGVIVMWSGSVASIPTGWALCNGSNGTPDLRSRFIVGATSDASTGVTFNADTGVVSGAYGPGNTGGSVAHQLSIAEMPAHTHLTANALTGTATAWPTGGGFLVNGSDGNTSSSTGSSDFHENRPPYYALAFIMKT